MIKNTDALLRLSTRALKKIQTLRTWRKTTSLFLPSQKEEAERKRLSELIARNKRLTEFIRQTETLLRLIRTEQGNIANQLLLFQKMKCSSASPLAANDLLITASDIDALATTALVLPNNNIHQQRQ